MLCDELKRYTLDVDFEENAIAVQNDDGGYMDASEVDAAIAELKEKCEAEKSIGATFSKNGAELARWVEELRVENRKLKRALYKACANWAKVKRLWDEGEYDNYDNWENVERRCLKKVEDIK